MGASDGGDIGDGIRKAFRSLLETVGGAGCVRRMGYVPLHGPDGRVEDHKLYALVLPEVKGLLIGREGSTIKRIRELLKTRMLGLGRRDELDARILDREEEAPPSTVWVTL